MRVHFQVDILLFRDGLWLRQMPNATGKHFRGSQTSTSSRRSYGLKFFNLIGPGPNRFACHRKGHYTIKIKKISKLGLMK